MRLSSEEIGGQVETNLVEMKRMEEEDDVETEVQKLYKLYLIL